MKATEMTTAQRQDALRQAQEIIDSITPILKRKFADQVSEEQMEYACVMYSRAVIIRAQLTSMEGARNEKGI